MKMNDLDRRDFLVAGSRLGVALCGACLCPVFPAFGGSTETEPEKPLDPKKLNYCGYTCPGTCKFRLGTLEDDVELKKRAFEAWKIEERYGIAFDPETAVCWGCKAPDRAEGVVVANCDVRACARDKRLDSCIECSKLVGCDRDLWRRFPDFRSQVVEMRTRYLAQS